MFILKKICIFLIKTAHHQDASDHNSGGVLSPWMLLKCAEYLLFVGAWLVEGLCCGSPFTSQVLHTHCFVVAVA
jgi:hypothetical protein